MSLIDNLSPVEIFQLTVIGEARGEPIESQTAVANVIKNRIHHNPARYIDYSSVCLEKEQFSCWNENDPNRNFLLGLAQEMFANQEIYDIYIKQCIYVANGVDKGVLVDNSHNSIYYMTTEEFNSSQRPEWAKNARVMTVKGNHTFFNV